MAYADVVNMILWTSLLCVCDAYVLLHHESSDMLIQGQCRFIRLVSDAYPFEASIPLPSSASLSLPSSSVPSDTRLCAAAVVPCALVYYLSWLSARAKENIERGHESASVYDEMCALTQAGPLERVSLAAGE